MSTLITNGSSQSILNLKQNENVSINRIKFDYFENHRKKLLSFLFYFKDETK